MVEVTEARITQADMVAAEAQAQKHYQTAHDYEMDLRQAFATHREAAAKAERDRIVAWLREMGSIRGGVADAIEALEHLEEKQP